VLSREDREVGEAWKDHHLELGLGGRRAHGAHAQASMPIIEWRIASIVIANPPGLLWMRSRAEV